MPAAKFVTQQQLADILGLSTRQIRNLEHEGLPLRAEGKRKLYPIPDAVRWYVQREQARVEPTDYEEAKARKMAAEAELAEIQRDRERGRLLAIEDVEREHRKMLERLAAALKSAPAKYAPRLVGRRTVPEMMHALKAAIDDLMLALSELGDEQPDDEIPDEDASDGMA
jgi:phage terminase Nu1 subunit (DNA packaging protein)